MSFNVENLFVRCSDFDRVANVVEAHWHDSSSTPQPDWGLPSSSGLLLAKEPKRKLGISAPLNGWVALVESKDVVDFALANTLSKSLDAIVIVIQLSESTGGVGYALVVSGKVMESEFHDEHNDPLAAVRDVLKKCAVRFDVIQFREVVPRRSQGWIMKQKT